MSKVSLTNETLISDNGVKEHLYNIQTRGYTVIPGFIDGDTAESLKELLIQSLQNYTPKNSERAVLDRYLIHDLICQDVSFGKILEDPRLQQLLAPIIGEHWIMYAFTSSSLPPNGSNYGRRLHVDCGRFVPGYTFNMGVIWALDDFTNENGGTELLPGSHHSEIEPSEDFFEKNHIQLTCTKGALILFSARLYHRSGFNRTNEWRHALTLNACRSYMKQRMDWVRFIPSSVTDVLNNQARRIIGFDTRLPASLAEFFVPEEQRLYKPNQG